MDRGVKIPWVVGLYFMGRGSKYHGEGVDILWVRVAIYHG